MSAIGELTSTCRFASDSLALTSFVHPSGAAIGNHALVRRKTKSNFGFRRERSRENRFELSKASLAHSDDWQDALE
jgi:hypothetical protein